MRLNPIPKLFARRGELPPKDEHSNPDPWTSFEMTLREPAPIPAAFDFTRFLTSSLTFMTHLSEVSVYFDDKRLSKLHKSSGIPKDLTLPRGLRASTSSRMMTVAGLQSTDLHISASVVRWVYSAGTEKPPPPVIKASKPVPAQGTGGLFASFFSGWSSGANTPQRVVTPLPAPAVVEIDPMTISESSVTLSIFSATVHVRMDKKMETELHRSTKKKPPARLAYQLIYTGKDEYDTSLKEEELQPFATGSVFQGLRADLDGSGSARVFIGHATAQTTGIGGHMSSRFIPTVERESIDLVDRHVAVWNRDLLSVGGYLARAAYEIELANIKTLWTDATPTKSSTGPDVEVQAWLNGRALHALRFFTFHASTPSPDVSSLIQTAFFACGDGQPMAIISTAGVRPASEVRMPNPHLSKFLKQLAVVPADVLSQSSLMVSSMAQRGLLAQINFQDVLEELRNRPLNDEEMVACLQWWIALRMNPDTNTLPALLNAAVLTIGEPGSPEERIITLSSVKTFVSTKGVGAIIPPNTPLPEHVLPLSVSKVFTPETLITCFPWSELNVPQWLQHLVRPAVRAADIEHDICLNAAWAEKVLTALSRAWPSLSNAMKKEVVTILWDQTCIPTSAKKNGMSTPSMKRPEEAYFANANVFPDLPIIHFASGVKIKGTLEVVLQTLGVRKHVDLQIVFDRMVKPSAGGAETTRALVAYLVDVQSTLSKDELAALRRSDAFGAEPKAGAVLPQPKCKAVDLYEPIDVFRQMGLPILDWGQETKWKPSSNEATFLRKLGLRAAPPLITMIQICASPDVAVRTVALKYLLDNFDAHYFTFQPQHFADVAFIPALHGNTACLGTPSTVFHAQEWVAMGFKVVHPTAPAGITKLKLRENPPTALLVGLLQSTPPKDETQATQWFGLMARRIGDFTPAQKTTLSQMDIVPTQQSAGGGDREKSGLRWLSPSQCFLSGGSGAQFHSRIFVFVNFGSMANAFLAACGTNSEPSVEQIVQILLKAPHEFYKLADGRENFLTELRNIAVNSKYLTQPTLQRMKRAPILLAAQRKKRETKNVKLVDLAEVDDDDWQSQYNYDLKQPDQILIADDTVSNQFFGDSIFVAPQEDILEEFYITLGSSRLSQRVKEEHRTLQEVAGSKAATRIRALILERLPLFLSEESTLSKPRFDQRWLNTSGNFVVREFGQIVVIKSLDYAGLSLNRKENVLATARRVGSGPVELWAARNPGGDMYDISASLCRLLFRSPKTNDTLSFQTFLSTDLNVLKSRVDRIMQRHRAAAALAADERAKARAAEEELVSQQIKENLKGKVVAPPPPQAHSPAAESPYVSIPKGNQLSGLFNSVKDNLKRKTGRGIDGTNDFDSQPPPRPALPPSTGRNPNQVVTPLSNIASNIDQAIKACAPERQDLLQNREHMQMVSESLNDGYCDLSGHPSDMESLGNIGGVGIYVAQDVPEPSEFLVRKRDTLRRFMTIIEPLSQVYNIPITNLHVFCDMSGPTIAFNRGGSIFFNLRFYEIWHDQDIQGGRRSTALISWFFTLAHEIAHNLVQPHNSEHEFWFSAICEKHIVRLTSLLH